MNNRIFRRSALALLLSSSALSFTASATIVEFQTSEGNFQVNLYDETTPKTVDNFLAYLNNGSYTNHVIHRVVPDFIVQGGGYAFEGEFPLVLRETNDPINNEPLYSNVKGTIAMAKVGGEPDSATSQWFFNLTDNSANLDLQNGGFTVFGEVVGDGLTVIEAISKINSCAYNDILNAIPMPGSEDVGCSAMGTPGVENFVTINDITIVDSSPVTASDLTPALSIDTDHDGVPNDQDAFPEDASEYLDTDGDGIGNNADSDDDGDGVADANDAYPLDPTRSEQESSSSSGGGSFAWLTALLVAMRFRRK